ncbi:glycoside hydrolase family 88 protein [candidate division KSB1 bacterium]|nr:glycoside hydrolase family 88 protein [candidate division KSB1 bacterium]
MKKSILLLVLMLFSLLGCQQQTDVPANDVLRYAFETYSRTAKALNPADGLPRTTDADGHWIVKPARDWTSGFYPGVLWYLFEFSGDPNMKQYAENWTAAVEGQKDATYGHDVGFQIFCSFGNGYRLTKNEDYKAVILKAASSLATRFNDNVGATRSWDWIPDSAPWTFPVIIDNMMNLELLLWAGAHGGDSTWYDMGLSHAHTAMKNHIRADNSTFHVVDFNPETGERVRGLTWQGYADSSCWARGQAWGLYGFTMVYRETQDTLCLHAVERLADYYISHLPADYVPYWDFQAPDIPNEPRDASAAAIAASGLLELSRHELQPEKKQRYFQAAENTLKTLCSSKYLTKGKQNDALLLHCVGHRLAGTEVDVPLIYADYYFVEALVRYRAMKQQQ